MKIWEPKSCCFCFDARNGSLIVGTLRLIGSLINIVFCVSGLLPLYIRANGLQLLPSCVRNPEGEMCNEQLNKTIVLISVAVLVMYSIQALVSIMLIHGIRKSNSFLMIPFMAFVCAGLTFYVFGSVFTLIYYCHYIKNLLMNFVAVSIAFVMELFFLLVIRSHYMEITRDDNSNYKKLQQCEVVA